MRAYSALCLHEGLEAGSPFWPISADHTSPASASAAGQLRSGRLAPKRCDTVGKPFGIGGRRSDGAAAFQFWRPCSPFYLRPLLTDQVPGSVAGDGVGVCLQDKI